MLPGLLINWGEVHPQCARNDQGTPMIPSIFELAPEQQQPALGIPECRHPGPAGFPAQAAQNTLRRQTIS